MQAAKRVCRQGVMSAATIGTHNGAFHCDEALACFMLKTLDQFKDAEITRTRDRDVLDRLTIIVDVGDVYDPDRLRFDHHQKGFFETFSAKHTTKLSSAGLIYKHFGKDVIRSLSKPVALSDDDLETLYQKIYTGFIEGLDGIDNGVEQYRASDPSYTGGLTRLYSINTDLSSRVGRLNTPWNETFTDEGQLKRFHAAMQMVGAELADRVREMATIWLPGRQIVADALSDRLKHDPSGRVVVLNQFCPWKDHLHALEETMGVSSPVLYIVYEDSTGASWRVQAVPVESGSFESRCPLPAAWRGLRDDDLSKATGVPGGVFVHMSGFIGGNKTREGALEMAKRAAELTN